MTKIKELLTKADLKHTPVREQILELFLNSAHVLSFQDLQARSAVRLDKVTVYRTLHTFVRKGLLHEVPDAKGMQKYGLCSDYCPQHVHQEDHIHFSCAQCGQTFCLDLRVVLPPLPMGYVMHGALTTVTGVCRECQPRLS